MQYFPRRPEKQYGTISITLITDTQVNMIKEEYLPLSIRQTATLYAFVNWKIYLIGTKIKSLVLILNTFHT